MTARRRVRQRVPNAGTLYSHVSGSIVPNAGTEIGSVALACLFLRSMRDQSFCKFVGGLPHTTANSLCTVEHARLHRLDGRGTLPLLFLMDGSA